MGIENRLEIRKGEERIESSVGLRLQDVLIRIDSLDPNILDLRKEITKGIFYGDVDERTATLNAVTTHLFGKSLSETLEDARKVLVPYHGDSKEKKTLIVSSASSSSASQETECAILETRGHIIDIPGAIEGRDTRSTQKGDIALISTKAGQMMAKTRNDVEIINLADEIVYTGEGSSTLKGSDIYYKSDGLLLLMLTNPNSSVLAKLVDELSKEPLVYPYNLDEETQIVLLWLSKKADIDHIDVNANSPEVGTELTRKGYRYPDIENAMKLPTFDDPYVMQRKEWELSQAAHEINHQPDCVPGYVINRTDTYEEFHEKVVNSLEFLNNRYGLDIAWVKPDRGTDGGNQSPIGTDISDVQSIDVRAREMWEHGGNWVVEANTTYFIIKLPVNDSEIIFMTTPSVHIIKGQLKHTISLQLVDGVAWGGNLICSEKTWEQLVGMIDKSDPRIVNDPSLIDQLKKTYHLMPQKMGNYINAINGSKKYKDGQVRGGADLAIATLGGKFGNNIVVAVQDYNARANGCETAYALYDQALEIYGDRGEAITRNITPKVDFDTFSLRLPQIIEKVNQIYKTEISIDQVKLIAISAGWGQFGMIGDSPMEITKNIFLLESQLRESDLIQ